MLRPRKITFYRMMLAGFLSAKAYRALKPKVQIGELSFSDCFEFEPEICSELKKIFENDTLREKLYCLEKIEDSINLEWNNMHNLLLECMETEDEGQVGIINTIGEKTFVMDYVFCSDVCLRKLNYVSDSNIEVLNKVRRNFAVSYKSYLETGSLPGILENHRTPARVYTDTVSEEKCMLNSIGLDREFSHRDDFGIDSDALSIDYPGCRKYVQFLYSLDSVQFGKIQKYLVATVSKNFVRLNNAIKHIGYRNFLVNFLFADDRKFFKIRNLGRKSLLDFKSIKPQIIGFIVKEYNGVNSKAVEDKSQEDTTNDKKPSLSLKEKVGEVQYTLLTNLLKELISDVSMRTRNGINNYKGDFIEDFVHQHNNVRSINNIGEKSEREVNLIISQLREAIDKLYRHELTDEDIFFVEKSSEYGSLIDDFCHSYYRNNGHLPMLHILANCISSLLENRNVEILNDAVSLFSDGGGNELGEVANKHNLTRERVRQICVKVLSNLSEKRNQDDSNIPLYHKLISQKEDWTYVLQILSEKKLWGIDELEEMLQPEECSLNKELVLVVLYALFPDDYTIVGRTPLSIKSRSNGWSNTYFISKKIADSFDFDAMIAIVRNYESANTESMTLTIQELLMDTFYGAWRKYEFSMEEDLGNIVGRILVEELNIIPSIDFKYTIEGKKEKDPADILYRFLKESGDPLVLDDLYTQINLLVQVRYRSANSLRAIIKRDPRLCFLGTNNMVALSEWNHVQIGNIRELIVSFLAEFDTPQHINDIVSYVLKHRNTSEKSISSTMGTGSQFVKYAGGYYGLADRTYPKCFVLSGAKRSSQRRIADFEEFIKKNLHFPFCPSDDKEEENMCQWWYRTKKNKDDTDTLKQEINRIESIYSNLPKNKSDFQWQSSCHRYRTFVIENGRQPSERNSDERELAKWFTKALDDVEDGKLTPLCEREFIKLCKSL